MRTLRIVAHGQPAAQGSKKHVGNGRMVEMSKKLPGWRATVEAAARLAAGPAWEPIDSAVSIAGEIRLPKPKTTKFGDYPAGAPDADKLMRAIGDALTKSRVIVDDARIVHWNIRKVWGEPGADITIYELTTEEAWAPRPRTLQKSSTRHAEPASAPSAASESPAPASSSRPSTRSTATKTEP